MFLPRRPLPAESFGGSYGAVDLPEVDADVSPVADTFSLGDYSRIMVYDNPAARRAAATTGVIKNFKTTGDQHGLTINRAETSASLADNVSSLHENLLPGDILAIIAGDGGVSAMLEAVRLGGHENPVLIIGGGNKNDIAHQLLQPRHIKHPEQALAVAAIRQLRPILAAFRGADGAEQTVGAYGYISSGVSSTVARDVTTAEYRKAREHDALGDRLVAEWRTTIRDYLRAQPFHVRHTGQPSRPAIDIVASNGNRMAGLLHPRAELLEPGFRFIEVRNRLLGLAALSGMAAGMPVGRNVGPDASVELAMSRTPAAFLQIDGEVQQLVGDTMLHLSVAPTGVNVLTTR